MEESRNFPASSASVSSFFEADHRAIDKILLDVRFAPLVTRLIAFEKFDRRLRRHIVWEEELLFPALATKCPQMEQGPLPVMRMEHHEIHLGLEQVLEAMRAGDEVAADAHERRLLTLLSHHNHKEENIIYPACDQFLGACDGSTILRKISREAQTA